jgi:DNA polymerase-1
MISAVEYSGVDVIENEKDSDGLLSRRFNINLTTVKVQTYKVYDEEKEKEVPKPLNSDLFVQLGAIYRYAKSHCYTRYATNYTGMQVASSEFVPENKVTYRIPIDRRSFPVLDELGNPVLKDGEPKLQYEEQKYLGEVTLLLGEIVEAHLETDTFKIDLVEDKDMPTETMYDFKVAINKGFKFDEEHLGFYVEPTKVQKVKSGASFGLYKDLNEVIKNHPERNFSWLLNKQYIIVDDEMLDSVIQEFEDYDGLIFFDTETTGLNITFKSRIGQGDQLVGVVLSKEDGVSYYFPLQHKCIANLCNGDHWYFMERYMKHLLESHDLVAHNMAFDWKVAYIYGINAKIIHDTMAIFHLTYGAEKLDFKVGLKPLAKMFLGRDSLELSDLVTADDWGESDIKFWDLPYELVRLYAPADTDNTKGIFDYAMKTNLLQRYNAERVYNIEIAFSYGVAYQEFYGHKVDTDRIEALKSDVQAGLNKYMSKMEEIVGYSFNPNSPPQLQRIMYEELGIPKQYSRKTGNLTTDKDTLKELAELEDIDGNPMYPFVLALQKFREYENIRKNFIKNLNELATPDGYLFSGVQQYGTTTGRVSIKKPNYQSYNDVVKQYIIPRPGFYSTDNDYSSVEYRVLAGYAEQPELVEAFFDPELDYHTYQASRMFDVPYEAVDSKLRKSAKGINFGLPYGMGDKSLGIRIFGEESAENTRKAGVLRTKYFVGQEKIQSFFERHRDNGVKYGYTETYFGRRRYYHRSKFSESAIRRQAGNQVIQGTAADLYKMAVGSLFAKVCENDWLGKVLFTGFVHDEIFCEVSESIDPMVWMKTVRDAFEMNIEGFCPLFVGFGFGMSWYQAKKTEIPTKLQIEMENKWGTTGYPAWENMTSKEFCDSIPDMIRDYEIRATVSNITSEESQGKTIKPMIYTYLSETIQEDVKLMANQFKKDLACKYTEEELNSFTFGELKSKVLELKTDSDISSSIKSLHIEGIPDTISDIRVEGKKIHGNLVSSDLQDNLDLFCVLHGVDRSKVNLINTEKTEKKMDIQGSVSELRGFDFDIEDAETAEEKARIKASRIEQYGLHADFVAGEVTVMLVNNQSMMNVVKGYCHSEKRDLRLYLKDVHADQLYQTDFYISPRDVNKVQEMYFEYFRTLQQV